MLYALVELSHPSFLNSLLKSALAVEENHTDGKFIQAPSFFVFRDTFSIRKKVSPFRAGSTEDTNTPTAPLSFLYAVRLVVVILVTVMFTAASTDTTAKAKRSARFRYTGPFWYSQKAAKYKARNKIAT